METRPKNVEKLIYRLHTGKMTDFVKNPRAPLSSHLRETDVNVGFG